MSPDKKNKNKNRKGAIIETYLQDDGLDILGLQGAHRWVSALADLVQVLEHLVVAKQAVSNFFNLKEQQTLLAAEKKTHTHSL